MSPNLDINNFQIDLTVIIASKNTQMFVTLISTQKKVIILIYKMCYFITIYVSRDLMD